MSDGEIYLCCKNGDLDNLKKLLHNVKDELYFGGTLLFTNYLPLRYACKNGHLEMCKWIYKNIHFTQKHSTIDYEAAMRLACINGHIDVCKWLYDLPELKEKNTHFSLPCFAKHFNICQWLCDNYEVTKNNIINEIQIEFSSFVNLEPVNLSEKDILLKNDQEALFYLFNFVNLTEEDVLPIMKNFTKEKKELLIKLVNPIGSFTKPVKI